MKKQEFEKNIEQQRKSLGYKNYLAVRDAVFAMLEQQSTRDADPSRYWSVELAGFDYMFDASPLIVTKLRHHSYHLTGLKEYEYRDHHARVAPRMSRRLDELQARDRHALRVPESRVLGGFGYTLGGELYNVDTLKFYESLVVMDEQGLLDQFRNTSDRKIVLEIGAGWGGLAYQFKTLFPNTTYVIVDLPGSILFGATYLKTLFPSAKIFLADGAKDSVNIANAKDYDFIFIPHFAWKDISIARPDLLMNMCSFQEMTTAQVQGYLAQAHRWGIPHIYSINRDHSPNNPELTRVSEVLSRYYAIRYDRYALDAKPAISGSWPRKILTYAKTIIKNGLYDKKEDIHSYRHLIGVPN